MRGVRYGRRCLALAVPPPHQHHPPYSGSGTNSCACPQQFTYYRRREEPPDDASEILEAEMVDRRLATAGNAGMGGPIRLYQDEAGTGTVGHLRAVSWGGEVGLLDSRAR